MSTKYFCRHVECFQGVKVAGISIRPALKRGASSVTLSHSCAYNDAKGESLLMGTSLWRACKAQYSGHADVQILVELEENKCLDLRRYYDR